MKLGLSWNGGGQGWGGVGGLGRSASAALGLAAECSTNPNVWNRMGCGTEVFTTNDLGIDSIWFLSRLAGAPLRELHTGKLFIFKACLREPM